MSLLVRMKTRGLLRDTTHLSIGQGFRLVIQAAYFVLIARALGPDAYGAFVTVVAMAALLGPFSGLGTATLFIKNVRSGKREASICWGNGILLTVLSGTLLSGLGAGLSALLHLKTVPSVVTIVCVADLVLLKVTELAAFGFTALDQMKQTSIQSVVVSLLRLGGIVILVVTMHPVTLNLWVLTYLLTTLLGTLYALMKGGRLWGRPVVDLRALREDAAEGVFFSVAGSATTIYNDIDKIMLSRLADLAATGVYSAAYRVIDVTMTPVRSLAAAAYPQLLSQRAGWDGSDLSLRTVTDREDLDLWCAWRPRDCGCWLRSCPTFWESSTRRWFPRCAGWHSFRCYVASTLSWRMPFPAPDSSEFVRGSRCLSR